MSRTALVTGATAGIGLAFAQQLAGQGYDVVLVARDTARLQAVADELTAGYGIATEVLAADLTDRAQLATLERRLADPAGTEPPIDLLVNNAGFGLKGRFLDNDVEQEQAMLDVLVVAVMRLTHAALRAMAERGEGGIINVSSVAGYQPRGTYSAAKAWVNSFSEWAANEYRPRGVHVMALCPGFTRTEFHERMGLDAEHASAPGWMWLDVEDLVATALKDFGRRKTYSVPSAQYKAIVGVTRAIPRGVLQRFQSLGRK
jgi:short-subunit dehydrogenase